MGLKDCQRRSREVGRSGISNREKECTKLALGCLPINREMRWLEGDEGVSLLTDYNLSLSSLGYEMGSTDLRREQGRGLWA